MHIVGKFFRDIKLFEAYISSIRFDGWTPKFVVVHNTSVPTQALYKSWHDRKEWTPEQWLKNLASYYSGLGWNGCPHLFVAYDGIGVLNDLTYPGTHSPSWNKFTWGVETVAEFQTELFEGRVRDNLVHALSILHSRLGLNPSDYKLGRSGLHFHKEDVGTTHKDCPGKNLKKLELVKAVVDCMNENTNEHIHVPEASQIANTKYLTDYELKSPIWLQQNLNAKCNAGLRVDGIIGDKTKQAVADFQKLVNIKVDGIAGPVTRLALVDFKGVKQ